MTQDAAASDDHYRSADAELRAARDDLARQSVEVSSGGGQVRLEMSGTQVCRKVSITMEDLSPEAARRLEALVEEAVNRALLESQQLAARRLETLTGGGR